MDKKERHGGLPRFTSDGEVCIVVTGGLGFIGSTLVLALVDKYRDTRIVVLDKLGYCSSVKNLEPCGEGIELVQCDLVDYQHCKDVLWRLRPQYIFHLAAQTHVDHSFEEALTFTQDNTVGTHTLLEVMRLLDVKGRPVDRMIHVSTDEVYGESKDGERLTELSPLSPTNPYAATKASAENLIQSYIKSFRLPIIVTRPNNVYGPRQYPEKVVAKWILALLPGGSGQVKVHGDGQHSRSYIYVDDLVDALLLLLVTGEIGQAYNIGSEDEYTNLELAHFFINKLQRCSDPVKKQGHMCIDFVEDRPYNDRSYKLDDSKIRQLGWQARVRWDEGTTRTIKWYEQIDADHWSNAPIPRRPSSCSIPNGHAETRALPVDQTQHYPTPDYSHLSKKDFEDVYEPAEDTHLLMDALEEDQVLLKSVKPLVVHEIGSGSGCVITFLRSMLGPDVLYLASDLNPRACRASAATMDRNFARTVYDGVQGSLVHHIRGQIDLLVFNPPYVPVDEDDASLGVIRNAWHGGATGLSAVEDLLERVVTCRNSFAPGALIYIVFLEKTKPLEVIERLRKRTSQAWDGQVVFRRRAGIEHLAVVRIQRMY